MAEPLHCHLTNRRLYCEAVSAILTMSAFCEAVFFTIENPTLRSSSSPRLDATFPFTGKHSQPFRLVRAKKTFAQKNDLSVSKLFHPYSVRNRLTKIVVFAFFSVSILRQNGEILMMNKLNAMVLRKAIYQRGRPGADGQLSQLTELLMNNSVIKIATVSHGNKLNKRATNDSYIRV